MDTEQALLDWLSSYTGLELDRGGAGATLRAATARRCQELGCGPAEYLALVQREGGAELERLVNTATVVYTWFFRDPDQLRGVEETMRAWSSPLPMRIWIPGCATGEDVFSVAIIAEQLGVPARILGTDLNTQALAAAERAEYSERDIRNLEPDKQRFFVQKAGGRFAPVESVRRRACFTRHNLVDPVPSFDGEAGFDVILCRNVFIYFDAPRALQVFHRLARALNAGGHLILGASEIVYEVPPDVRAVQLAHRIAFQRVDGVRVPSTPPRPSEPPNGGPRRPDRRLLAPSMPVPSAPGTRLGAATDPLMRGHALLAESRLNDALEQYDRALAARPNFPEALTYRGITRYLQGDVETAAKDLRAALSSGDRMLLAIFYLALSYESMGLPTDALREYRRLVDCAASGLAVEPPPHDPLAGWYGDIIQLARHRVERAGGVASDHSRRTREQ